MTITNYGKEEHIRLQHVYIYNYIYYMYAYMSSMIPQEVQSQAAHPVAYPKAMLKLLPSGHHMPCADSSAQILYCWRRGSPFWERHHGFQLGKVPVLIYLFQDGSQSIPKYPQNHTYKWTLSYHEMASLIQTAREVALMAAFHTTCQEPSVASDHAMLAEALRCLTIRCATWSIVCITV